MSEPKWPHTTRLAEYSAEFAYEALPPKAVSVAKDVTLDTLGALFGAWPDRCPTSAIIGDHVKEMGGRPECTVLGMEAKSSAPQAALVNATMGYAADIEGGGVSRMHLAAVAVPTALVMAERGRLSGRRFLAALALAYDIASRVSDACRTDHSYPHSFHPSAVFGTFGAAALAGHALGLSADEFVNAYGLAGNTAGGLVAWVDDPTEHSRSYGIGMAAYHGVSAALLAGRGFGGPRGVFDAMKYNIFEAFSGEMRLEELERDLGSDFRITHADGFKRHPCCGDIHSGIDALLHLLDGEGVGWREIETITHRVKTTRRPIIDANPLRSHCSQYILAIAAVEREIRPGDILRDRRDEPAVRHVADRVTLIGEPELDGAAGAAPAIIEVVTSDGRSFSKRVDYARGRSENPLTRDELEAKFIRWAEPVVGEPRAREIIDVVRDIESLPDVSELIGLMQGR
jgi:2-methylcitrate dehydratase PrpD